MGGVYGRAGGGGEADEDSNNRPQDQCKQRGHGNLGVGAKRSSGMWCLSGCRRVRRVFFPFAPGFRAAATALDAAPRGGSGEPPPAETSDPPRNDAPPPPGTGSSQRSCPTFRPTPRPHPRSRPAIGALPPLGRPRDDGPKHPRKRGRLIAPARKPPPKSCTARDARPPASMPGGCKRPEPRRSKVTGSTSLRRGACSTSPVTLPPPRRPRTVPEGSGQLPGRIRPASLKVPARFPEGSGQLP